ncbi:hypothetical protein BC936DRAFT_136753 [Jimgerdemannia flammicorona]|uniref:Uncharacterized protein n=1 Tax=Jimgerdemannia flammicorona TaxID=994334 RepID=A0A433DJM1_9FUNG|nr:hypothetical protein BC936DRAFT_136753 [Jimgerdemannia flammicorona]
MSTTRPTTATVFPHQTTLQVTPTTRQQRDDIEQRELRQSAANILAQYSQLTMHTLASGEVVPSTDPTADDAVSHGASATDQRET